MRNIGNTIDTTQSKATLKNVLESVLRCDKYRIPIFKFTKTCDYYARYVLSSIIEPELVDLIINKSIYPSCQGNYNHRKFRNLTKRLNKHILDYIGLIKETTRDSSEIYYSPRCCTTSILIH